MAQLRSACWVTYARIQAHTHNIYYFFLFHDNKRYANASQCHVTCPLPILLKVRSCAYHKSNVMRLTIELI
jgi:hypothetical protein